MLKALKVWGLLLTVFLVNHPQSTQAGIFTKNHFKINIENADRPEAEVYLPKKYSHQKNWPLILLLHGYSSTGSLQNAFFGLSHKVSKRGFILLIPEGKKDHSGNQFWNATDGCCDFDHSNVNDYDYLLGLIRETQKQYPVDPKRIYVIGHSNGGFMAHRLACDASNVFSGIVSLAGANFKDRSRCKPTEPVSVLQIHALNDPTIKYDGNSTEIKNQIPGALESNYPSALETVTDWLKINHCHEEPQDEKVTNYLWSIPGKDTTLIDWPHCDEDTQVAFWTIRNYRTKLPAPDLLKHHPHIPWLKNEAVEKMLDFLFAHQKK